jgi:uncharacterized protein YjbJ (UPF0337 family)
MSRLGDKFHHAAGKLHARGKDTAGNDRLKAEGKSHHVKADLKQVGEKFKAAFKKH